MSDVKELMQDIGAKARGASLALAQADGQVKAAALNHASEAIWAARDTILAANQADVDAGRAKGLSAAMLDRLALDEERLQGIMSGLRTVAEQVDPVGEVIADWQQPNGLHIQRVRMPLGVVGVIFESRPNVTADAAALCIKSGNAAILRAGSESLQSARALGECIRAGLRAAGLPEDAVQLVPTKDRAAVGEMLTMGDYIDVIVPRGGRSLVERVQREARVPVFAHLEGIVHIYLDRDADADIAQRVVLNAKTRRPGICGAAECLLIHKDAKDLGQNIVDALIAAGVEVRAEGLQGSKPACAEDWGTEFLDLVMAVRLVDDFEGAIAHIRQHSSSHTDCILTENPVTAEAFFNQLDSAILMHNASTQFADGGEFGMGAEIGIATGKMHARGPVGATQLTTFKYHVRGRGAVRS